MERNSLSDFKQSSWACGKRAVWFKNRTIASSCPSLSFLTSMEQDEIHTDDETERARLEEATKKTVINKQICFAIGKTITVWLLMLIAAFLTH